MLNPKIKLFESPIHGVGLYAADVIGEAELVWQLDPYQLIFHRSEIEQWPREKQLALFRIGVQFSEDEYAVEQGINGLMNHSCDPNTWWLNGKTLIARRLIDKGEEVTCDYTTGDIWMEYEMECRCSSPLCRGVIRNTDFLDPKWQETYGSHLPDHVLKAIAQAKQTRS